MSEDIRGFIDLGTNSVRLSVVRFEPHHVPSILAQRKETVRLGEGQGRDGKLREKAMQRAAAVCREFADMARGMGAGRVVAIATSATREAENQDAFLDLVRREAGLDLQVISGREEARLIYLGVARSVRLDHRRALFIDIGGGSTELVVGNQSEPFFLDSLRLGAIRLTDLLIPPGDQGPVGDAQFDQIKRHVEGTAVRLLAEIRAHGPELAVGSSGTIETLADITARRVLGRPYQRGDVIRLADLSESIAHLRGLPLEARRAVPGLSAARADIIVCGAAILETIMERAQLAELWVSDRGLRDGLIVDALSHDGVEPLGHLSVRDRSVLELGRSCRFDERHHRQVARLALGLFDSAARVGLHAMDADARELLDHAAMLHDVGAFLSYDRHQHHSYYLIKNADLLGFNQHEIGLIAAVARFHRRGYPGPDQPELAGLARPEQVLVERLSTLLRLAEHLDRSHAGRVAGAWLEEREPGGPLRLLVRPARREADCQLELWGLGGQVKTFERAFGRPFAVGLALSSD